MAAVVVVAAAAVGFVHVVECLGFQWKNCSVPYLTKGETTDLVGLVVVLADYLLTAANLMQMLLKFVMTGTVIAIVKSIPSSFSYRVTELQNGGVPIDS